MSRASSAAPLSWWPPVLFVIAVVCTLSVAAHNGQSPLQWLAVVAEQIQSQPAWLLLVFLVRPLLLFPISVLVVSTGALLGSPWALALAWLGQLISAASAYVLARLLRPRSRTPLPERFSHWQAHAQAHGFQTILLMRLTLVPFDLTNFGAAWMRIDWRHFLSASAIGILPSNWALCSFGLAIQWSALLEGSAHIDSGLLVQPQVLAFSAVLLVLSLTAARWANRRKPPAAS